MKIFIFLPMILTMCHPAYAGSESTYFQRADIEFAKSLQPGDCYRAEQFRKAEHRWERSYTFVDQVHYVMAKDDTGLLIAQPKPECEVPSEQSAKCVYWFRTMEYKAPFLINSGVRKVKCPSGISQKSMIERLKKSDARHEYDMGDGL